MIDWNRLAGGVRRGWAARTFSRPGVRVLAGWREATAVKVISSASVGVEEPVNRVSSTSIAALFHCGLLVLCDTTSLAID